jgi:hypothetical protein
MLIQGRTYRDERRLAALASGMSKDMNNAGFLGSSNRWRTPDALVKSCRLLSLATPKDRSGNVCHPPLLERRARCDRYRIWIARWSHRPRHHRRGHETRQGRFRQIQRYRREFKLSAQGAPSRLQTCLRMRGMRGSSLGSRRCCVSLAGTARLNKNPWPRSHPCLRSAVCWADCSIPSAVMTNPSP